MAWKDILDFGLKFAEKVLSDASLWFWFGVAIVALIVADSRGLIPLARASVEPRVGLTVLLVVVASLWLNALEVHRPIGRGLSAARMWVAQRRAKLSRERQASRIRFGVEDTLRDLLRTTCRERRWFIWFAIQIERDPNLLLPYGTILHDEEFAGARSLLKLGLLHRTGDNESALVFIHRQLWAVYSSVTSEDAVLAQELAAERQHIEMGGRLTLSEKLPTYATERFFRATGRHSTEGAT